MYLYGGAVPLPLPLPLPSPRPSGRPHEGRRQYMTPARMPAKWPTKDAFGVTSEITTSSTHAACLVGTGIPHTLVVLSACTKQNTLQW